MRESEQNSRTVRAQRTVKKKKSNTGVKALGSFMYILMILGISLIISTFVIVTVNDVFALVNDEDRDVTLVFAQETSVKEAAVALEDSGMIRYPWAFRLYASLKSNESFASGTFEIKDSYDYGQIIDTFNRVANYQETVLVTIPEGFSLRQIAQLLEDSRVCNAEKFIETCNTYAFKHEFLQDVPMVENRLEGYLFPDTYEFYVNESPVQAANKMLNNFNKRYTDEMRDYTEKAGMTIQEVVLIASLIEKEAKLETERARIAGVIYNRLGDPGNFPYLQIDATVLYALNKTEALTDEDLKVDSPYNTYKYQGLPPTAICNPGVSCLLAAIIPEEHRYYYYVVDTTSDTGQHIFSKTLQEHNNAIANMKP